MTDRVAPIPLAGGLDELTPSISISPGVVSRSLNYEAVAGGGYRKIGGYRRWSGRDVTPATSAVQVLEIPLLTIAPGDVAQTTVRGTTFRAISSLANGSTSLLVVEKARATAEIRTGDAFTNTELGTVLNARPVLTEAQSAAVFSAIERYNRGQAQEVPGSGDIVLIQPSETAVFAIRMQGTTARVSRNTPGREVFGPAGGWLDSGTIANVDEGARWEAYSYRFDGSLPAIFVVNGVTPPYRIIHEVGNGVSSPEEIDDSVANEIGVPNHVIVHKQHLFFSYPSGRVIFSDIGDPMSFTAIGGGGELSMGDEVTGFEILPGGSLGVYCEDRIGIISGSSAADFRLDIYSDEAGAIPGTLQGLPTSIFCDRRAITTLAASDAYGNFASKALSQAVDPTYQKIRSGGRLFSVVSRSKSQYRIINQDGRGLFLTFDGSQLAGAMEVSLGRKITAVGSLDGDEDRAFIAGDDGYIYQLDAGTTFDGEPVDAFLETADYHFRTPQQNKAFKQLDIELEGDPRLEMQVTNILDGGVDEQSDTAPVSIVDESRTAPRYRDELLSRFSQRFAGVVDLYGTGRSQAIRFEPLTGHDHAIKSMTAHYTDRGQRR